MLSWGVESSRWTDVGFGNRLAINIWFRSHAYQTSIAKRVIVY